MLALAGKDSMVSLDLCCQVFSRVEAFHMYIVKGLESVEAPMDAFAKRMGVPLHYVPHWDLARMFKHGYLRPPLATSRKIRILAARDVERSLTTKTDIHIFAYGERASDSFVRRFYTRENDGIRIREHRTKLYPIWDWKDADVYGYMKAKKIPAPPRFGEEGKNSKMSGFGLNRDCLTWLKRRYPNDYAKVLKVFPYAEIQLIGGGDQIPTLPNGKARTWADFRSLVQPTQDHASGQEKAAGDPEGHQAT
jgi:hypothetical protein